MPEIDEGPVARTPERARRAFRPEATDRGGLEIEATSKGSLEFVFHAYGSIEAVLLSRPVEAAIVLQTLLGWFKGVTVWVRKRHEPAPRQVVSTSEPEAFDVQTGERLPVPLGALPSGTSIRIRHVSVAGDETTIEIRRD